MTIRIVTANTAEHAQDRYVSFAVPTALVSGTRPGYRYKSPAGTTFIAGSPIGSGKTTLMHLHRIFNGWENQSLVCDPAIELGPCRACPGDTPTDILITATVDGAPVARTLELSSIFYSDPILTVWSLRERLLTTGLAQTKLTVEGYYYQWANHPVAQCEIVFVAANTAVDAIRCDVTDLRVQFVDADYARGRWNVYQQVDVGPAANQATLISGSDYIADGQATPGYVFDVVTLRPGTNIADYIGVSEGPPYAMLHPDDWEGHLFMQGGMPDLLPADQADGGVSAINALIAFWGSEKARNNRWDPPDRIGGLWRQPGAPSERADYGSGHPASLLSAGQLSAWAIDMNLAASMREWIRAASHYRESNAEIVDWDDHPLAHAHGEKRHGGTAYNGGGQPGGPDLFGQSHLDMPEYQDAHDIGARNYEHWTSNQLLATACVTGSFLLYDRLREISRAFARAFTGYYTGWQTEGWGIFQQLISVGHRAEGRSRKSVSRAYWLTGETQVRDALWQRLRSCAGEQDLYSQTWGDIFKYQILRATPYEMFTLNLQNPASGYFDDPSLGIASADRWSWIPWQVGLAIEGLHDTLLATGDPTYETPLGVLEQPLHYILTRLCETFVRYGWVWNSVAEEYFMPKAIRWAAPNGDREGLDMPVDHSLYQPGVANNLQPWIQDSRDTAYAEWNWAGLKVALEHYLTQDSDRVKAQAIDAQLKAAFEASTDFGLARYNNGDPYFPVGARYGVSSTGQLGNA